MARLKVLVILINLVLLRLVVATELAAPSIETSSTSEAASTKLEHLRSVIEEAQMAHEHQQQAPSSGSASVFDHISSLDYSPVASHHLSDELTATGKKNNALLSSSDDNKLQQIEDKQQQHEKQTRPVRSQKRRSRAKLATTHPSAGSQLNSIASLVFNVLGQLEKVDVKRVLADLSQLGSAPPPQARTPPPPASPIKASSGLTSSNISAAEQQQRDGKLNVSALTAEGANLLGITKQLVKLARNQVLGDDQWGSGQQHYYASSFPGGYQTGLPASSASWLTSAPASMLSAASHALHDSLDFGSHHSHHQASLKSDWFWWAAPAVIVVGAGVIVVPLIAAWLVSQAMSQNAFTLTAGRRRRRRSTASLAGDGPDPFRPVDLFKLLDLHQLLDDAPELLVEKLSKFYSALDSIGARLAEPQPDAPVKP